jgi:hypothetical protein
MFRVLIWIGNMWTHTDPDAMDCSDVEASSDYIAFDMDIDCNMDIACDMDIARDMDCGPCKDLDYDLDCTNY